MDSKQDGNRRAVRRVLLAFSLIALAFFEFFYLFGFLDGTCYAFCVTFYNLPCLVFSVGMFLFGLTSVIAWFPKYTRVSMAFLSAYFGVTLLASLCWARWVPVISFVGLVLAATIYQLSPRKFPSLREFLERFFFGLALSTFLFLALGNCLDVTVKPFACALVLLGALSIPLRVKYPRYSPVPLLLYFVISLLVLGFHGLELFGLVASALALLAFDLKASGEWVH
ncbi:hypothetical protein GQS_07145 [Thermococcus sp. 4557]|uniref:hypothetical protein n=1 Tax=Thermococcus sp. (strain CGMCC 1.5172 / 4557) TaxID=1042877 RepID=UPI000219EAC9|nr:hypothetical protein [Thermococcus sp. 4557]AEK73327.1 hypothetical protein GQS_07145 [Thermococcus sp. 4557]